MYNYTPSYCSNCPYMQLLRNVPDNAVTADSRDMNFSNDEIKGNLRIPVLKGSTNPRVLSYINSNLENDILEFKRQMENAASENAATKKTQNKPVIPFQISNTYSISYNKNNLISLSLIYTEIIDGISYYIRASYNYGLDSGRSLQLQDLFKPGTDYKKAINTEILNSLDKNTSFKGISDNQSFYLDGNNLVIFLGFNEIGFSPSDIPVIRIPFSKLSTMLKPELLRNI
ncbi:DUF4163 domain-containing protein [Clostridium oryzae]|uniref:Anti-sigma-V factor RsiV n=1 Tax=Clostridium oryzae TaxID=1450648 RepID=A0A1V4IR34_9CLOT|nr:DUF3298 and DUF4163 domain-containing protein [Clostridium oryzae]OPJ62264.1 hypothetical protein CLORY_18720 [Clostridium oryzae]